ncbi:hypothetical protein ANN_14127 [Periplaneta americana]|uniref:Reverse transcriptase domain-containing protein n=1 Tax=Periplaneta americana TaxID=6978 RepID=A0ABQ8SW15_PERAM|nr:hypothetical protein ANN_14127 [Periplaneta americana]
MAAAVVVVVVAVVVVVVESSSSSSRAAAAVVVAVVVAAEAAAAVVVAAVVAVAAVVVVAEAAAVVVAAVAVVVAAVVVAVVAAAAVVEEKRNWLGHWLRRNCLLKDALEEMVNGRRVRGRRRYQMIDDIKIYGSYEETKRKAEHTGKIGERLHSAISHEGPRLPSRQLISRPYASTEVNDHPITAEVSVSKRAYNMTLKDIIREGRHIQYSAFKFFISEKDLPIEELTFIISDGAPSMVDKQKGFIKSCPKYSSIQTIRENAEILLEASKEIGLEVNPEKTKYMIMSRDQNIVRNGTIKVGDLSFEEVEKFKYLGATVTNINDTREEIKRRINMGNACCYSVENLLSSSLLSKNLKVRIYKTVILPVVLYSCETWTLTLREEQRLRVFENKVLRKIFGAKRDEVTGEWRKLHNAELHALYLSPDIIRNIKSRRLRWAGHVARMGESRNAYRVLVGRPEGKRPLGRPRRRWEDNIKMDLREVGYDDRGWINLAQDRDQWRAYVRAAMNLRVP